MVQDFIPGQRWINDAELQLGLGTILTTDHRTVTILFLATGDTRVYSKNTAPLTRVAFGCGDKIRTHEGWTLTVTEVDEENGLLIYIGIDENGESAAVAEGELDNFIQLNRPTERLFSAKIDHQKWFDLRYNTLQHANFLAQSDLRGLIGGRTSLLAHQLYIAHEVANRYAPRVLLADEVGLGKTIEAGLILHQQLLTERAQRVLIVVPESLVHQWLVEMLRRFNLRFSIFDEERCLAAEEGDNPFNDEQLVLCNLEFLVANRKRHQQAMAAQWDLLVVDEAHHLKWSPERSSPEYDCIEALARETKGVILLTATPEQLGKESHFARLRLLDADRFPDFDRFIEEEKHYEPIAQAVEELLEGKPLAATSVTALRRTINDDDSELLLQTIQSDAAEASAARTKLVEQLLDRHGTGRVLFRNTRAAVKGFPDRCVTGYPLPMPAQYRELIESAEISALPDNQLLLSPELLLQDGNPAAWATFDPRIEWLQKLLKTLRNKKVLVITHNADSAMDIAERLRVKSGIHAAMFHEHMSILERDRAAAFFADAEYGSPV
ncbi:MAG TPA: RNA polymerase-associated protein RapA, partial [Candidatus Tenderia sp.]|nr:RNA polymerase-associated protein RapA [Candidatus Tenderia sp.]